MFDGFKIILCWYRILRLMFQAVPYSRDYKRKYEYMKSQLRKPVSVCSVFEIHTYVSWFLLCKWESIWRCTCVIQRHGKYIFTWKCAKYSCFEGGGVNNVSFSLCWTASHEGWGTVPYICDYVRMSSRPKMILNKVFDLVEYSLFSTFSTPASTACGARNVKL